MYVSGTSETANMTNFENFYNDLLDLAKKYELQNTPLKIENDLENDIIKIFVEKITSISRSVARAVACRPKNCAQYRLRPALLPC